VHRGAAGPEEERRRESSQGREARGQAGEARPGRAKVLTDDTASEQVVRRLARPTSSGGHVIERAAVLAEGPHCADIEAWILRNGGEPEVIEAEDDDGSGGVYADRRRSFAMVDTGHPARYHFPADALPAKPAAVPAEQ
jgi:hypothetical protein